MIKLKNIFKNRNTYMEELSVNLLKEISNRALSAGTVEGDKDYSTDFDLNDLIKMYS